jgi:nucleotide-binding universal stress UspA family protein
MLAGTRLPRIKSNLSWEYENLVPGGVVVGVDGSRESIAALNSAAAIARRRQCPLHAVTVLSPFPEYRMTVPGDPSENINTLRLSLRDSELGHIVDVLEPADDWTHEVVLGRPAPELTRIAEHRGADVLVIGRSQHAVVDRVLGGETVLQIMRMSAIPVLAVDSDLEIPRTVVAAVDFSPSSILAAKSVLQLMNGSGSLYLVFVEPPPVLVPQGVDAPKRTGIPTDLVSSFRGLIENLGHRGTIRIETVVLNGRAASAVVQFAERVGSDLITTGSHGHGRLERFLLGSVSTGIVRNANCAVLVVPPTK